ncbi:MAG: hypothetical protein ACLQU1_41720 [Bryobacteraceae bacterium]
MIDLNSAINPALGIHLAIAEGINDQGQIIANGVDANGNDAGFLLTSESLSESEPSSFLLLAAGFCALANFAPRRTEGKPLTANPVRRDGCEAPGPGRR